MKRWHRMPFSGMPAPGFLVIAACWAVAALLTAVRAFVVWKGWTR